MKEGMHTFSYELDATFTDVFPVGDAFAEPDVHVEVDMEKRERMMLLSFRFSGTAGTQCDRCLKPLRFRVDTQEEIIVKMASDDDSEAGDGDNLWWITEKDSYLDLAPYFYETITLSRPLQVFCPEDKNGQSTCDKAMLSLYGQTNEAREPETDPRWNALKELKDRI